ncbi:MAG: phage gp6-like head-tail connector protein [Lachnospiraceae bacterium]|nr:phage gp6-like head-tail connector protein [Lachnospiraceae bacterium]
MNNDLVGALLDAIPDYIETSTGLTATQQSSEPLVETVTGFLLTQWYYADHADDQALTRTINSLLKVLSIRARDYEE